MKISELKVGEVYIDKMSNRKVECIFIGAQLILFKYYDDITEYVYTSSQVEKFIEKKPMVYVIRVIDHDGVENFYSFRPEKFAKALDYWTEKLRSGIIKEFHYNQYEWSEEKRN